MKNSYYNKGNIFCICFFLFFGHFATAFQGKYPIQNFTPNDYMAGIQNIDFAQNRDMTLFVANNLGVLSFNGNEWNRHDFQTGKKKRSLAFQESTNRLYVGSQGEFGFFEQDWQYVSLLDKIPEEQRGFDEVWDVYFANGYIYFCTFQGIYVYDGESISVIRLPEGLDRSFISKGRLFTQNQQGKLFEIENQRIVPSFPQIQSGQTLAGIIGQDEGYLLFYNSGQIEFTTLNGVSTKYEELIQALEGTYVNHVTQLSDTRLAIATQTAGLFLYDLQNGTIENINKQDGLESNACLRSFQDYFGNLWLGMQNGIALIHINSPLRLINQEINIQGSGYEAFETEEGTYYTTSNGIYYQAKNKTKSIFLSGAEGPAYGMQEIAGNLYAGHHTGLFLLENGTAKRLANTEGLWQIKQLRSNPKYAIGGTYSGLYLFQIGENQLLKPIQKIEGFNSSSRFFEEDQQGNIWVGQYYQGLYQLTLSEDMSRAEVKNISEGSDLPVAEQVILSKAAGKLYLATYSGLFQLDLNTNQVIPENRFSEQINEQEIYLFEEDQKNNIHILAEDKVGFFKQISANNYLFVPSSLYQLRYYLNNDLLQISTNMRDGILFSANEGFIHYDPALEGSFSIEKPLVISQVFSITENTPLYQKNPFQTKPETIDRLTVNPAAKVLNIEIESFQFNNLNNQQFRYFLKGFDNDFGEWTNTTSKEYTNLKEGKYEFIAQSKNYLGEIINSPVLSLKVRPPLYRSLVARIIYLCLGGLALFMVVRFQRNKSQRIRNRLEESKRKELAKKQEKLIEIEQQKEKELIQLKEEKMHSELQHLNNLLAASTMNLVVKNEFIDAIKEELKEIKQKGRNPETKQALEKIVKGIDITLRLQEDWEQFEYHFDKVHGGFLTRLRNNYSELSPNEQKLCAFLRLNLNTKEIANLLSISLRGVEVARYRLRKKLNLETGQNLSKFILEY